MSEELTTVEILALAIRSEEEAAKFYGGLAKRIKNDLARAKYESLAYEEASHRQLLINLYRKTTGEDRPPEIPGEPRTAEGGGVEVESEDIERLLQIAIEREQKAGAFYKEMSSRMKDANGRRLLQYLADIERGHEVMLQSELEAYRRDKNWYADNPDIQLV
jgi:rubrerythrin